jgi:hypothetical protein
VPPPVLLVILAVGLASLQVPMIFVSVTTAAPVGTAISTKVAATVTAKYFLKVMTLSSLG